MAKTIHNSKPNRQADVIRLGFEIKSLDESGQFSGYAAVWNNTDVKADVCKRGCFLDTIAAWEKRGTLPRIKWRHFLTIGHCVSMAEDDHGLMVSGRLWMDADDTAAVYDEIQQLLADGEKVGMSFAFCVTDCADDNGVRVIAALELLDDLTITPCPVNPETELIEIKDGTSTAFVPSARDTEAILRDAGFSRSSAKRVLGGGYSALRDVESDAATPHLNAILTALQRANRKV